MKLRPYLFALALIATSVVQATPTPPSRIVSLAPVATEFLFALGLGDHVVGVTTYCDRPVAAKQIAKIGGFADPQLETILRLRPDLVVSTPYGGARTVAQRLDAKGIRTLALSVESLRDMRVFLAELGKATHRSQQARELQATLDAELAQLKDKFPGVSTARTQKPKVLLLISSSPLIGAGPATFMGEILAHLGAQNVVTIATPAWPILSLESLMHHPPDIVIVTEGEKALEAARAQLKPLLAKYPKRIWIFAPKEPLLQRPGLYLAREAQDILDALKIPNA